MSSPDDQLNAPAEETDDTGTIVLMLSLYLIMLAFFILLNAISEDSPEKIEQATESLMKNFSMRSIGQQRMDDQFAITAEPVFDLISDEVRGIVMTYFKVRDFSFVQQGEKLQLKMPVDRFFVEGDARLKPAMVNFFEEMAETLGKQRAGFRIEAQVLVKGEPKDTALSLGDTTPFELAGRRSSLFVRALGERGANPELLSAAAIEVRRLGELQMKFNIVITDEKQVLNEARRLLEEMSANEWLN